MSTACPCNWYHFLQGRGTLIVSLNICTNTLQQQLSMVYFSKGELVVLACGACMSVSINLSLFNTLFLLLSLLIAFMLHVHSGLLHFVHADLSSLLWFFTILRIFWGCNCGCEWYVFYVLETVTLLWFYFKDLISTCIASNCTIPFLY